MSSHVDHAIVPVGTMGVDPNHPARSGAQIVDAEAGIIERRRDNLAIVGYATSTRHLAPYDDTDWEIIGLNQLYRFIPRADFWADLHRNWNEENVEGTDHEGWIRECGIPVLMHDCDDRLPTSVCYPIHACIGIATDYFTSSISLLIAWAIYQGYKKIGLYGIDLVVGTEYEFQKACAEFWLGVAHGKGIDIHIPQHSALLKHTHRYGYDIEPSVGLIPISEMESRSERLRKDLDTQVTRLHRLEGAISEIEQRSIWVADPEERLKSLKAAHVEAVAVAQSVDGARQENKFTLDLLKLRSRLANVSLE